MRWKELADCKERGNERDGSTMWRVALLILFIRFTAAGGDGPWYSDESEKVYVESLVLTAIVIVVPTQHIFLRNLTLLVNRQSYLRRSTTCCIQEWAGIVTRSQTRCEKGPWWTPWHTQKPSTTSSNCFIVLGAFTYYLDQFFCEYHYCNSSDEFMVLGFIACIVWLVNRCNGFEEVLIATDTSRADYLGPTTASELLHVVEDVHMCLFASMALYFASLFMTFRVIR